MDIPNCGLDCLLHDHGDGARPIKRILPWLYEKNGKAIPPGVDLGEMVKAKFDDPHGDIIEAFSHTTGLLQSEETIFEFARNHVVARAEEGILYDEVMLAPHYHLLGEFKKEARSHPVKSMKRVISAVVDGIKAGERERPEIEVNMVVAIGRELSVARAVRVLKALEQSDRDYVVGANLVCDESAFPPELHVPTFDYANRLEINFEFHASEWVRTPEQKPDFIRDLPKLLANLKVVLDLYVKSKSKTKKRIGHGISFPFNADLLKMAVDNEIGVTGCPGSNLQGHNIPNLKALAIRWLLVRNLLWSMNPDDDLFQPNINETFQMCDYVYNFTEQEKLKMRINAWKTRFGHRKSVPKLIESLI